MTTETKPLDERMRIALAGLFNQAIFDAQLLSEMKLYEDRSIPTAATDCYREVRYNPDFFDPLPTTAIRTVLAHEARHKAYLHAARRGDRDPAVWNIAGDLIINAGLHSEKHDFKPWAHASVADIEKYYASGGLGGPNHMLPGASKPWIPLDPNLPPDESTERIYDRLMQAKEQGKKAGKGGKGKGQPGQDPSGGVATGDVDEDAWDKAASEPDSSPEALQRQVEAQIGHAVEAAKSQGNLPGHLQRLADAQVKATVDWRRYLKRLIQGAYGLATIAGDYSYRRPNRRYADSDIIRPTIMPQPTRPIVIVVDVSGSIGQAELNVFQAELRAIISQVRPSVVHVLYVDTAVRHHDTFEPDEVLVLKAHGGGGTDLEVAWPYIKENCRDVAVGVVLTDGLTSYNPANQPRRFPVVWGQTGDVEAPYGKNVAVRLR